MNKNKILISSLFVIAALSWGFYIFQTRKQEDELAKEREKSEEWVRKVEETANENAELREKAERNAVAEAKARQQAEEAQRMAELKAREEEAERQRRIAELNERLIKEADERRKAETALAELAEKMQTLESAQAEAHEKLLALEAARGEGAAEPEGASPEELGEVRAELREKEEELALLTAHQKDLEKKYQDALRRQIATGEEIIRESSKGEHPTDLVTLIRALLEALGIRKGK